MWRSVVVLFALVVSVVPAQAKWLRATSQNLIVYSEQSEVDLRKFARKVEQFDAYLCAINNMGQGASPLRLTIYIVRGADDVTRLLGPEQRNALGFYASNLAGSMAVVPRKNGDGSQFDLDSETILFHEYTHRFMLQYFPVGYPAWYVEGFAEYYSTTEIVDQGTVKSGLAAMHRARELVLLPKFPLKRMFAEDIGKLSREEGAAYYGRAWLLTHYLRYEPSRKGQIERYLKLFSQGTAPAAAAEQAFGDVARLDQELVKYLSRPKMSYTSITGLKLGDPAISITSLPDAEGAMMPLAMRMAHGSGSKAIAETYVKDARANAAKFPNEALAQELLAEGELDVGMLAAATSANDAVLAVKPNDARALLRRARIRTAEIKTGVADVEGWKAVRSMLVKANHASSDDPFILSEYFLSFKKQGIAPSAPAIAGLRRALELAPEVAPIRFMLAVQLFDEHKTDEAKAVIAPLLNDPHNAEMRTMARALAATGKLPIPVQLPPTPPLPK